MPDTSPLETIIPRILDHFAAKNAAREQALAASRTIIRLSANTIRAIHRGEFERAGAMLGLNRDQIRGAREEFVRITIERFEETRIDQRDIVTLRLQLSRGFASHAVHIANREEHHAASAIVRKILDHFRFAKSGTC